MVTYGIYSEENDITFVMQEETKYNDGKPYMIQSVVGFYYGEPSEELNKEFTGKTTAEFDI